MSGPVDSQRERGTVEVSGARLSYEAAGTGHPLVLLHAGVADQRMWDEPFAAFARHYRVVRYDARGYGASVTEDVEFSNREDLAALLDHLGIERTHLLGVSRGTDCDGLHPGTAGDGQRADDGRLRPRRFREP